MSTAATIISRALRLIGVIPSGGSPSTNESADCLTALNALLASWNNPRSMCFATQTESVTLANGTTSYTIGPTGGLVTVRPVAIEAAWILESNYSYPVEVIGDGMYDGLIAKTTTGDWPTHLNYRPTMPDGTIYVYPVPNAARTLKIRTRIALAAFSATTDTVTLPPGWERALAYNLAVEMAPEFEKEAPPTVQRIAGASKAAIGIVNSKPVRASNELANMFPSGVANILTDQ